MELFKECTCCNKELPINFFIKVRSKFFFGGYLPICADCLDKIVKTTKENETWDKVNKLCQWADVPFLPREWEKIYQGNENRWFWNYCKIFGSQEFETVHWQDYNEIYLQLHKANKLEDEVPGYEDTKYEMLAKKWGAYDRDDLDYLENLFNETLATQNVNTSNQIDQLRKICKTSLLIDQRISANQPYKDLMDSYERLVKVADLTPKNTKNSNDFDSVGEIYEYLEQKGWQNKFYDGIERDEIDETIKNTQNWTRRLCLGESTLTEEIMQKLNNLSSIDTNDMTDYDSFDFDMYEKDASDIIKNQEIEVDV